MRREIAISPRAHEYPVEIDSGSSPCGFSPTCISRTNTRRAFWAGCRSGIPALLVVAIVGALAGRMVGAQWMQWVEARWR